MCYVYSQCTHLSICQVYNVLNPESNILVSMVQLYDYSCTAMHYMYSLDLQLCTQLYGRTTSTSTTKFSRAVDR